MLKVDTLIQNLLASELSNHALATSEDTAKINSSMLHWINQAIRDINLRIPLIQKEKTYNLVTDSIDGGLTYTVPEDFMALLSAYDEKGRPIPVNDESNKTSIFLPEQFKILIPYSTAGAKISIIYQAKVPTLVDVNQDLPIGEQFENIIYYYVAMKALASLETQGKPVNIVYEQRYNAAIQALVNSGMYIRDSIQESSNFVRGGWR